ncbi:Na+/H+ antiporter [Heyndrickxia acidicola]|uniref:Na+/H+ antiporter n=1 Tax=Heyndrickxia acidicola TaxID=209389 RepID=A0ABU6MM36_9BACI|nr:Na+/H+ antiporter [Heyndrickxia acidicola]MED1204120.1 Na+/H+ antiporter [Heyndrickxia acidicola]
MDIFIPVLILLSLIGLSNVINHFMPYIPAPIVQIALGVMLAAVPIGIHIPMQPELFFVVFIAPLLFNDGRNVSRGALWKLKAPILLLALGLVFVTVFAVGFIIHWLVPSIPLPAAFALAAILSPTDAVAVSAISDRVIFPKSIMHLLEGEGLMNDASGLVAFKFAVAATVTGTFSLVHASLSFLAISVGGFLGGALLAYMIIRSRTFIRRLGMEDVTLHMLIQILTPSIIYLIIEHLNLSGILAVVAAGIVHSIEREREESPSIKLRLVSQSTWTVLLYVINGLVFVLLGLQIPGVASDILKNPIFNHLVAIQYTLFVTISLLVLRFLWVYLFWNLGWRFKLKEIGKPSFRQISITAFSGVRGAVTLAGAFSIPFSLANGHPFPERPLIIFIAAGVILLSLSAASIFLPILAKAEEEKDINKLDEMEKKAYIHTQKAAILATREELNEENKEAALAIIDIYHQNLNQIKMEEAKEDSKKLKKIEIDLRLKALEAESSFLSSLLKKGQIDRDTAYLYEEHVRRMEIAVTNRVKYKRIILWLVIKRAVFRLLRNLTVTKKIQQEELANKFKRQLPIKMEMAEAAIRELKKGITPENKSITYLVIGDYNKLILKFKQKKNAEAFNQLAMYERELQFKAFQAERDAIQQLYEKGKISLEITRKIRQQINIREAFWEENHLPG